jgi:hypothetical protein
MVWNIDLGLTVRVSRFSFREARDLLERSIGPDLTSTARRREIRDRDSGT